jgi:hypothetical protein
MYQTYVVTNPDPGAGGSRVHFSRVELDQGDKIYVKDSTGKTYQVILGSYPTGLWSEPVHGRDVQLLFVTGPSGTSWGFCVDRVETVVLPTSTPTPTRTLTPTRTPCPSYCSCVGYCSCHGHHYWYPC